MLKKLKNIALLSAFSTMLIACSGLFDKDNTPNPTPLKPIVNQVNPAMAWSTNVGNSYDSWLKQTPAILNNVVYTTSQSGDVYAVNVGNGQILWRSHLDGIFAAGPSAANNLVLVATRNGKVTGLDVASGKIKWTQNLNLEILANTAVNEQVAIIKSSDGEVRALQNDTGNLLWSFRQPEPNLTLHSAGLPLLHHQSLYVGFANGNLAKLNARTGQLLWIRALATPEGAFAIERMIDIDADPLVFGDRIYAASFQGNIGAFEAQSGRLLWSHRLSSYTGMSTDGQTLFITDAKGELWAFEARTGKVLFKQTDLLARGLSAPVIFGHYVVVGDKLGYLHWLNQQNGQIVGRVYLGSAIMAAPLVDNNRLIVLTQSGRLSAYTYK